MKPRVQRLVRIVLVAAVLAVSAIGLVAFPTASVSAQGPGYALCTPFHIVQWGENLYRIATAYGTTWPVLAYINGISNPNYIWAGMRLCLPPGSAATTPPPYTPPGGGVVTPPGGGTTPPGTYFPPAGVYPSIDFNTRVATNGQTIQITGRNFPGSRPVNIHIAPQGTPYPATPSGTAVTNPDGTLLVNFTIPADVAGVPLTGWAFSIIVHDPVTGYFGFNWIGNSAGGYWGRG